MKVNSLIYGFEGFYNSYHEIDDRYLQDYFDYEIDPAYYQDYSKVYAEEFIKLVNECLKTNIKVIDVVLKSPKEYNFSTDWIECVYDMSMSDFHSIYDCYLNDGFFREYLEKCLNEDCTNRSGYIPLYPNDVNEFIYNMSMKVSSNEYSLEFGYILKKILEYNGIETPECLEDFDFTEYINVI